MASGKLSGLVIDQLESDLAAETALTDDLADVLINWGDEGYEFVTERSRALARYREARQ